MTPGMGVIQRIPGMVVVVTTVGQRRLFIWRESVHFGRLGEWSPTMPMGSMDIETTGAVAMCAVQRCVHQQHNSGPRNVPAQSPTMCTALQTATTRTDVAAIHARRRNQPTTLTITAAGRKVRKVKKVRKVRKVRKGG